MHGVNMKITGQCQYRLRKANCLTQSRQCIAVQFVPRREKDPCLL